jgi:hypothetical protein
MVILYGASGRSTIIPDYEIPVGKSPFEHGYLQARSFIEGVQGYRDRSETSPIRVLRDEWVEHGGNSGGVVR